MSGNVTMTVGISPPVSIPFNLTILSVSFGLDNGVHPGFVEKKGIVGNVYIGEMEITDNIWLHRPKLTGEIKQVYTKEGSLMITWDSDISQYIQIPLTCSSTIYC